LKARRAARFAVVAPALGAAIAMSGAARANEADTYGLGSRSTAMGGAVAADVSDFSANYYDPAGLVAAPGVELSIGYTYAANRLLIDGKDTHVSNLHGLVGGLVAPGKFLGVPFAFGIGTYLPDSGLSRVKALRQETPRWALYDERSSILFLAASLAVRPAPWLEIGGGATFLAATHGSFEITGKADVLHPYDSVLRHEVDADLDAIRYPQLGARVKVADLGHLALVYRGETKLKLEIDAHLKGNVDFASVLVPLQYDLASRTIDAFLPQQVVLGASFSKVARLHVNLDLAYVNWAAFESPTARTDANLHLVPPPGVPITIPPQPKPTQVLPPRFSDRLVPHLGVEYVVPAFGAPRRVRGFDGPKPGVEVPLRAGYVYEATPVPPQTGVTNFVDTDRHTITAGTGLILNAPTSWMPGSITLDIHGQLSILPQRITSKASAADFVGDYTANGTMAGIGSTLTGTF
jgi:long-chain fatty acid transport protein